MKPTLPLLAVSLAANAALIAFLLLRSPRSEPSLAVSKTPASVTTPAPVPATGLLTANDATALARAREVLATDDLPTLVARLRAAGFSMSDTRAIVAARLSQIYGAKRAAAVAQQEVVPYWRSSQSFPEDPKLGAIITGLVREQAAVLKQLLGADAEPDDAWSRLIHERQYGYLPPDKLDRVQNILADYNDMREAFSREARKIWLPEDQERMNLLEKEKLADLAKVLTPEEVEAYQLHSSQTATVMRFQLAAFQPTEEEFRALYRLNDETNILNHRPLTPAETRQVEAALGPARMAEFIQTTDQQYMRTNNLVARLDLPASVLPQIISVRQDLTQQIDRLGADATLTPAAQREAVHNAALAAEARLTALLGEHGYQIYKTSVSPELQTLLPLKPNSGTGGK
ncbi:MAG: hypothetical protein JSS11_02555 [Verrucomicrobia bacterium]|nr:hypothetical protein [Verrucomicrobiota bacterium]